MESMVMKIEDFWKNKKVLITGHTGFKGSWLSIWLNSMGAIVIGYALSPKSLKDNYILSDLNRKIISVIGDIRDFEKLESVFNEYNPDIVFHLAAQPLVLESYKKPVETYDINVMGTLNILECIRRCKNTKVGIMVTTDKCYLNKEQIWGYREEDAFGGYDPYSSSKACAEILIDSYRKSYFSEKKSRKYIASVRAGNVIGGGDWSENRIIPDAIRSIEEGKPIKIRNPEATRPWQHVLEPLYGYMMLAEKLYSGNSELIGGWNFGPNFDSIVNVWNIAKRVVEFYGKGEVVDVSINKSLHEAKMLSLDITKARQLLGWKPIFDFKTTVKLTVDWYKRYEEGTVYDLCVENIKYYMECVESENS